MSATRRVDGSQPTDAASVSLLTEVFAAIAHACSLVDLDDLLCHLATTWCQLTRAERAVVGVQVESRAVFRLANSERESTPSLTEIILSCESDLLDQVIDQTEASHPREGVEPTHIVLTSVLSSCPVGKVVLWGSQPLTDELQTHLCQCSADLLIRAVASDHLLREAKLEALGEFAAGAGHEINNPIAAISGRVQLLLRDETDPLRRRHLLTIGAQSLRVRDMIGDSMLFARPPEPEPRRLDLAEIVFDVQAMFAEECGTRDIVIGGERTNDVLIWADETQLRVVISELLRNAIHASPDGGRIEVKTRCETASDGRTWARLTVQDEGEGLSDESREHLFDPFYSGRQAGRGLGFGLSKCWRIVTNHGGQIDVATESDSRYSVFFLWPSTSGVGHGE